MNTERDMTLAITITGPQGGAKEHLGQIIGDLMRADRGELPTKVQFNPSVDDKDAFDFDYIAETDLTASGVYGGYNSSADLLAHDLKAFIIASKRLDQHKKVLFRKRSNAEAGLPPILPGVVTTDHYFPGNLNDSGDQRQSPAELLHGIIGICTESGELAEVAYDCIVNGKQPDMVNVKEECGDQTWYLARILRWAGADFFEIMKMNIAKLRARHGDAGFNAERDANRNHDAERALLEGGAS